MAGAGSRASRVVFGDNCGHRANTQFDRIVLTAICQSQDTQSKFGLLHSSPLYRRETSPCIIENLAQQNDCFWIVYKATIGTRHEVAPTL